MDNRLPSYKNMKSLGEYEKDVVETIYSKRSLGDELRWNFAVIKSAIKCRRQDHEYP